MRFFQFLLALFLLFAQFVAFAHYSERSCEEPLVPASTASEQAFRELERAEAEYLAVRDAESASRDSGRLEELFFVYFRAWNQNALLSGRFLLLSEYAEKAGSSWFARRFSEKEIQKLKLTLRDGLIYKADGSLFDTRDGQTVFYPGGTYEISRTRHGKAMIVMDEEGHFYFELKQMPGSVHHTSFAPQSSIKGMGAFVGWAGEWKVTQGKLIELSDKSGHFSPPRLLTQQALRSLNQSGIDTSEVKVSLIAPESYPKEKADLFKKYGIPVNETEEK